MTAQDEVDILRKFAQEQRGYLRELLSDSLVAWFEERVNEDWIIGGSLDIAVQYRLAISRIGDLLTGRDKLREKAEKAEKVDGLQGALRSSDYLLRREMKKRGNAEERIKSLKAERDTARREAEAWRKANLLETDINVKLVTVVPVLECAVLRLAVLAEKGGQDAGPVLKGLSV